MLSYFVVFATVVQVFCAKSCYWNEGCPYQLYSSKTPYETVRGDIRDYPDITNCKTISVWTLNRHGNRNPDDEVIEDMKAVSNLKEQIIESYVAGRSQLCAQDIENLKLWTWNYTIDASEKFLTGTGYKELFDIGKRLQERYPYLLDASEDKFYFRPTNRQRTITSAIAFVHGLTEKTNLSLQIDKPWAQDDIIRPYDNCYKYQEEVIKGHDRNDQIEAYYNTAEFQAVLSSVQERLGIKTELHPDDIYSFYELCRFYRSWSFTLQSPWCAMFSTKDLEVLEYKDDVRQYYKNGYGSWVNPKLGALAVKDLYENFEAIVSGSSKRHLVSYFTHDTLIEMVFSALGLFKDDYTIVGEIRNPNRLWRTSFISSFSVNLIVVLNRCQENNEQTYRIQFFLNEKETELCPLEGCTWRQFEEKFSSFKNANLDFCSKEYKEPAQLVASMNNGNLLEISLFVVVVQMIFVYLCK